MFGIQKANVAFWLPKFFPDKVRVIVTCAEDSEAYNYFEKQNCKILQIEGDPKISEFMIEYYQKRHLFIVIKQKYTYNLKIKRALLL